MNINKNITRKKLYDTSIILIFLILFILLNILFMNKNLFQILYLKIL